MLGTKISLPVQVLFLLWNLIISLCGFFDVFLWDYGYVFLSFFFFVLPPRVSLNTDCTEILLPKYQ